MGGIVVKSPKAHSPKHDVKPFEYTPHTNVEYQELYEKSLHPATWTNQGTYVYVQAFGNDYFVKQSEHEFPAAPSRTELEKCQLSIKVSELKFSFVSNALARGIRPTHSSGFGVAGTAIILDNPNVPANTFFEKGKEFLVRIRHANALSVFGHDGGLEPRGMSIKFSDNLENSPLDLLLNTGEMMGFFNLPSFQEFTYVQLSDNDKKAVDFIKKYPSSLPAFIGSYRRAPKSYHDLHYYSQLSYKFFAEDGRKRLCKFRCVPFGDGVNTPVPNEQSGLPDYADQTFMIRQHHLKFGKPRDDVKDKSPTYLTEEYQERLAKFANDPTQCHYRLQIQLYDYTDEKSYDIFNGNKPWVNCPWHDIAIIKAEKMLDPEETVNMCYHVNCLPKQTLGLPQAYSPTDFNAIGYARSQIYSASQVVRKLRQKAPKESQAQTGYLVRVRTGTRYLGGTTLPVYITIVGDKGSTESTRLDHLLMPEFCSGSEDNFLIQGDDVGVPFAIKIEKKNKDPDFKDAWDLHSIIVENKSGMARFVCATWVENASRWFLRNDHPLNFGLSDAEKDIRDKELIASKSYWVWNEDKENAMPRHASERQMQHLPLDHQFSANRTVSFGLVQLESDINEFFASNSQKLSKLWENFGQPDDECDNICPDDAHFKVSKDVMRRDGRLYSINEFRGKYLFATSDCPERSKRWRSDIEFADRMIAGANPVSLFGIDKIPAGFNVTSEMVQSLMPEGATLESQLTAGHVYYINHGHFMKGIELWDSHKAKVNPKGRHLDSNQRYAPPVQGLFHVHPDVHGRARLMPLAIQLLDGHDAAVFTPKDSELDWLTAKTFFMVTDVQVHQMNTHLFSTHLIMEPFVVALERNIPRVHPVYKILFHHIEGTVAINTFGRQILIAEGGLADICMSTGGGGHIQMMSNFYHKGYDGKGLDFRQRFNHIKFHQFRNVCDKNKLPHYPYRDDGTALWDCMEKYVYQFLSLHYRSSEDIKKDSELQAWIKDLAENAFPKLLNFPKSFEKLDDVVEVITIVLFQLTVGHASVNFSQYDQYAHIPTCPSSALVPPPTAKGQFTMNDFMHLFPSLDMAKQQIMTGTVLASFNEDDKFLTTPYINHDLFNAKERIEVAKFKDELKKIDHDMEHRNMKERKRLHGAHETLQASGDVYHYMRPSRVPNSIAI